ncbi:MAG: amidohydrolase [Pricia sp.]
MRRINNRQHHFYLLFQTIVGVLLLVSCQSDHVDADSIVYNAAIWTGNGDTPQAKAMAISGDTILEIGEDEIVMKWKGENTILIDAKGHFVTPGFIDTHVHLISGGLSLSNINLRDAATPEAFSKRIADYAKNLEPGSWVLEGNWDHTLWGGELPNKNWIDEHTQENPVVVGRLDGHMILANSAALEIAGIDKNTPEVSGGEIVRNEDGTPTGILKDNAMDLMFSKMPDMSETEKETTFKTAMEYLLSNGVTSVHDVNGLSSSSGSYGPAQKLRKAGELALRIYAIKPLRHWKELADTQYEDDKWLKTGGLKGFVDGSLGSHTAAFKESYTDQPDDKGFFINSEEDLYGWISEADKADLQILVHAIGDRAIHSLLNIYERIIEQNGKKDRRLRIEHAQHIAPEDIKRFADLGVIASMQPYHAIDDGRWAEQLIGPQRIKTTYAFKSLIDAKATVVFGSDWAVAPATPLEGLYAAVTRRTLDDKNPNGWVPEQKITVQQALTAYTKDAAYASFEENIKGTLEKGKLADFVIIDKDLTQIDPDNIKDAKVLQTFVGGKKVFDANEK